MSVEEDIHQLIYDKSKLIDFLLENSASKVGELHDAYLSLSDLYKRVDDAVNAELAMKKANACIPSRPSTSISFSDAVNSRPSSTRPGTSSQRTASPSRGYKDVSEQDKKYTALLRVAQEQVNAISEDMRATASQPRESLETALVKECTLIREQVTKILEQQMVKNTTVEDESDLASLALTGTTVRVGDEGDTFNFWYDDTLNKVEAILSENKFGSKNKVSRQLDMEKEKWMTAAQHHLNNLTEQGQDDQANLQVDLLVDAFHTAESGMYQWQVEVTAEVNKISESILEDWKYQAKDQKEVEEDVLRQQHRSAAMDVSQNRARSADSSTTGRTMSPPNISKRGNTIASEDNNNAPGELSADINRLQQAFSNAIPEMTSRNEVEVRRLQQRVDDWRDRAMHTIEKETAAQFNHWKSQIDAQDDDSPEAKIAVITAIEKERAAWKMRILEQAQKMEERGRAPSRGSSRSGSRGGSRSGSRDIQTRPRSSMSPSSRGGEGSILEEGDEDEDNDEGAMEWKKKTLKDKLREEERALKIMTSPPKADSGENLEHSVEDIGDEDSVVWSIQRDEASLLNKPTSPVAARPPARGMTREEAESTYKALEDKYVSPNKQTSNNNLEGSTLTVEEEMIALQLQRQKEIDAQIQKQKQYWEDKQKQKDMERRHQQLAMEQREKERELAEQEELARIRKEAELAEVKAMEEAWTMMQDKMKAEKIAIKESIEEVEVKLQVKHKDSKKNKVKVKKRNQQKKIDHYQAEMERNHIKEMKRIGMMDEEGKIISAQKHKAEIHEKEKYILGVPIEFTSRDKEEAYKHLMEISENVEPEKEYNRTVLGNKLEDVSTVMDEPIEPAFPPANDNILLRAPVNVDIEKGRYGINTGFKTGVDAVWKYSKKGRQQPITTTPKESSEVTHVITMRDTGPLKAMLQERRDARASEIEFIYSQEQPKLILGQKHTSGHSSRHGSPQSRSRPRSRSRSPHSRSRSPRSRSRSPPKTPNTRSHKNLLSTGSATDTDPLMITDGSVTGFPQEGSYMRGQTPAGSVSFADFSHEGFAQEDDISQSLGAGMSTVSQLSGNNSSKAGSQSASRASSRHSRKPDLEYNRPISSTGSTRLHTRQGKYLLDNRLPPEPGYISPNADLYGDGALSPSAFPHIPQQDGAVGRIGVDIPEEYLEEQTAISIANSVVGFGQGSLDEEGSLMMIGGGDLAEGSIISQVTMDPGMPTVGTGSGFPGANDGMGEMQLLPAQGGSAHSVGSMIRIENTGHNKLASIQSPMQKALTTTFGNKRVNGKKKKKKEGIKNYRYPCEFPGCHATFNQSWELYNHHNAMHEAEIRSSNYRQKIRIPQEQVIHRYDVVAYERIDHSKEQQYLKAIEDGQMTSDDLHEVQVRMKLKKDQLRSTLPTLKKGGGHGNSNREFDQRLMNPTLGHYNDTTGGALTKYNPNGSQRSMNSSNKSLFRNTSHLSNNLSIDEHGRVIDKSGDAKRAKKQAAGSKSMNRSKMASFDVDVVRQSNKWEEKMQLQRWQNHTAHLKQWRKEITTLMRRQAKALPQGKLNRRTAENVVPKM